MSDMARNLSASGWFGHYLFLEKHSQFVAKVALIDTQFPGGCSPFPFSPYVFLPFGPYGATGFYYFSGFLINFLQLKGIGPQIVGKAKQFLEIVLKHVGWVVDPPYETKGYFEESRDGGFGIVRVTIQDEPE